MVSSISTYDDMQEDEVLDSGKLPKSVYLIAQEIKIAKSLAANDPKRRMRQLRKLRRWLSIRSNSSFPFTEDDFLRIWRGLYYCMWMSDKPLVQESLAEDLGSLLYCFANVKTSTHFFGAFLKTMCIEWFGIDQWRINKFMMLVRRMLRHMLQILSIAKWKRESVIDFTEQLTATVLSWKDVDGMKLHIIDIYLEEVAKVADGNISTESVALLIKPFIYFLCRQKNSKLLSCTTNNIFYHLLWQSDKGREYSEKFNAWKEMGFPTTSIDDLEKLENDGNSENDSGDVTDEDEEGPEKILDPRAGRVDVFVPEIPVDVEPLIREFESILFKDITNTKSRKHIREIIEKYKKFKNGEFPLGIKRVANLKVEPLPLEDKIAELEKLEEDMFSTTRKLKKLSKKKRKRLLSSINFEDLDDVNEENFDQVIEKSLPPIKKTKLSNNEWKEEDIKTLNKGKENKNHDHLHSNKKKKTNKKHISEKNALKRKIKTNKNTDSNVESNLEDDNNNADDHDHEENGDEKEQIAETYNTNNGNVSDDDNTEWSKPLQQGEIEYFVPSKKVKLQRANKDLNLVAAMTTQEQQQQQQSYVVNPFAKKNSTNVGKSLPNKNILLGKSSKKTHTAASHGHPAKQTKPANTPGSTEKKVKIMLHKNISQKPSEYIKQVRSSPQLPYDSDKKPTKSLLKPNLFPSPINPFYKKKIGLKLNDSF